METRHETIKTKLDTAAIRNMIAGDNIDSNAAERIAIAINAAIDRPDLNVFATKKDLEEQIKDVRKDIENNRLRIIIWLGGICFTIALSTVGLLLGVIGRWLGKF